MVTKIVQPLRSPARYPSAYGWYVALAMADVLATWTILSLGGVEVNGVAAWILAQWGITGITAFKCATVMMVVLAIEGVGARRESLGRRLSAFAVLVSMMPVCVAGFEIVRVAMHPHMALIP